MQNHHIIKFENLNRKMKQIQNPNNNSLQPNPTNQKAKAHLTHGNQTKCNYQKKNTNLPKMASKITETRIPKSKANNQAEDLGILRRFEIEKQNRNEKHMIANWGED